MRKVFSSQRVETVEGVAQRLRQAGIEVRIRNGRSWQGKRGGQFSYLDQSDSSTYPAVWVVHADDQVQARQLLRQAGLLDTTRPSAPNAPSLALASHRLTHQRRSGRLRIILLVLISAGMLVTVIQQRYHASLRLPAKQTPALSDDVFFRVPIYLPED